MSSAHDRVQDQHLADLDAEAHDLHKKIAANVRKMNQISADLNARLDALEPPAAATHKPSPRKTATKRGKPK